MFDPLSVISCNHFLLLLAWFTFRLFYQVHQIGILLSLLLSVSLANPGLKSKKDARM